jgi:hypothetical protein
MGSNRSFKLLIDWNLGRITLRHGPVGRNLVEVLRVFQLHKIGDVKERVALQANVNKSGLHSGKNAGDASFVNRTCQGVFVLAFEVDFSE